MQTDGKARSGLITAATEAEAFARLRADNLVPMTIRPSQPRTPLLSGLAAVWPRGRAPRDVELEDTFIGLAVLLRAGADIRAALGVLGSDSETLRDVGQAILGGASVDTAFSAVIPAHYAHLRGLIAAGEARGDLASGLDAAARVLATGRKIRQQLFEALSYPAFVFVSAVAAVCVILLIVVPAIAPLLQDTGQALPVYFGIIVFFSDALRQGWPYLLTMCVLLGAAGWFGWGYGGLRIWLQKWLLDGPMGGVARGLVFGGYAKTLGDTLSSGAALTDALRLCGRSLGNAEARRRLEVIVTFVRQGSRLSDALRQVAGFPGPIVKLCEVGEASGALGTMLAKAGEREEQQALARIDKLSRLLGPFLLVLLGAMIGGLMGGVLTALTDIGGTAGM